MCFGLKGKITNKNLRGVLHVNVFHVEDVVSLSIKTKQQNCDHMDNRISVIFVKTRTHDGKFPSRRAAYLLI